MTWTYNPNVWGNLEVVGLVMVGLAVLVALLVVVYIAGRKGV